MMFIEMYVQNFKYLMENQVLYQLFLRTWSMELPLSCRKNATKIPERNVVYVHIGS